LPGVVPWFPDFSQRFPRQIEAVPILGRLREELDRLSSRLLPKSSLAQAITYALNQWPALCRYTEDGRLTIDNADHSMHPSVTWARERPASGLQ
jgi:hypothetical protein